MAVNGCEFICVNSECDNCKNKAGLILTSPWPLGDIDKVLNSKRVKMNKTFREKLLKLKEEGRKYACISLPDAEGVYVVGYRVHMWCEKCLCDWTYDAMIPDGVDRSDKKLCIEEAIKNSNIPENCPKCNEKMQTFFDLISEDSYGIKCTVCKQPLKRQVWFCNEEGPDEILNPLIKMHK